MFFPAQDGRRLAAELPHAQFEIIEQADTVAMLDQTDLLGQLVTNLATVARR